MSVSISSHTDWVGKTDSTLTSTHGNELSTHHGSSHNSFLIHDRRALLIDTAWLPHDADGFEAQMRLSLTDLHRLDGVVLTHYEPEYADCLTRLLALVPDVTIYCSVRGEAMLRRLYGPGLHIAAMRTGSTLELGETTLTFIETPMLHWPDAMMAHLSHDNILFSGDCFGQHYCAMTNFNIDTALAEAEHYYANILQPFSPLVVRMLHELTAMRLPLTMLAPTHGMLWQEHASTVLNLYAEWSHAYRRNQVTILYDTMSQTTLRMAQGIADGIRASEPDTEVKLINVARHDKNDIVTEVFRSKAVLTGCPTVNQRCTYAMAGMLELLKGMKFRGKYAAAFGSYGWSGEAVDILSRTLAEAGMRVTGPGLRISSLPDPDMLQTCRQFGADFARAICPRPLPMPETEAA